MKQVRRGFDGGWFVVQLTGRFELYIDSFESYSEAARYAMS